MNLPIYETSILMNPSLGIYLVTTYWQDGQITTREVPKGPILLPNKLVLV